MTSSRVVDASSYQLSRCAYHTSRSLKVVQTGLDVAFSVLLYEDLILAGAVRQQLWSDPATPADTTYNFTMLGSKLLGFSID
jgi:hypothetical protein